MDDFGLPLGWYLIPPPTTDQIDRVLLQLVTDAKAKVDQLAQASQQAGQARQAPR